MTFMNVCFCKWLQYSNPILKNSISICWGLMHTRKKGFNLHPLLLVSLPLFFANFSECDQLVYIPKHISGNCLGPVFSDVCCSHKSQFIILMASLITLPSPLIFIVHFLFLNLIQSFEVYVFTSYVFKK